MLGALAAHAVDGLERHDAESGTHTRVVPAPHGPAVVSVCFAGTDHVEADIRAAHSADVPHAAALVRRWLDLDADPDVVDAALVQHTLLAPHVAARPGLRVLGSVDGFETAVLTVLGQQVSLSAARTFGSRFVAAFGTPTAFDGFVSFPEPETLAALDPAIIQKAVGLTGARARTVQALAVAASDGLHLGPSADPVEFRSRLLALPGIGPWTVDYLSVRVLGDRDAYPSGDLVLRRALGVKTPREAAAASEPWRPWRAYALFHLWTSQAFL
ncbi:3-methyladenine DNA glycosylase 2 [Prescottella equi]|jgi:DNA-3-methyladenine glycosylase II/AraC family transcriptional regulator of adaptative response / DNA-3-methyladenine glycosylase II|nr:AlkA N-terminal domain-containing protein [Prescottella equi]ORM02055.1 3-methyladenine DNA glycosylase 2 [Prescottella equi]ORM20252.1 3-methyladenine DNA glycosylase 2 [Prescottella equi]